MANADTNAATTTGGTALILAVELEQLRIAKCLVQKGNAKRCYAGLEIFVF